MRQRRGFTSKGAAVASMGKKSAASKWRASHVPIWQRAGWANRASRGHFRAAGELKAVDSGFTEDVTTTAEFLLLNGIARGDDIGQRIGRKSLMKSIEIRIRNDVNPRILPVGIEPAIPPGKDQYHRVLLVYDRQTNGTAPAITDILDGQAGVLALTKLENRARFQILLDKVIQLNMSDEAGSGKFWKKYLKVNLPIQFGSGNGGTVADIKTGSLYLFWVGTSAPGFEAGTINGHIRIRYADN